MQKKFCQYQDYGKDEKSKYKIGKYRYLIILTKVIRVAILVANKL